MDGGPPEFSLLSIRVVDDWLYCVLTAAFTTLPNVLYLGNKGGGRGIFVGFSQHYKASADYNHCARTHNDVM